MTQISLQQQHRQQRRRRLLPQQSTTMMMVSLVVLMMSYCVVDAKLLRATTTTTTKEVGQQQQRPGDERDLEIETRVVGGQVVNSKEKHPYFAEWNGQYCGGALIHDDLVLTAGHCNGKNVADKMYFHNIRRKQQGSVIRTVVDRKTHPLFDADVSTRDHDYMIVKLDKSALIDDVGNPTGALVIPINVNPAIPATGDALWGIGYGQTDEDKAGMSDQLRDATIYAFDNDLCESQYVQYFEAEYMFCSGVEGGGTDTCQGDSGGPIVHQATNTLVGIVSFGIGCARDNYAGVNSRVSAAQDWILQMKCEYSNYPDCGGGGGGDGGGTTTTPPNGNGSDNANSNAGAGNNNSGGNGGGGAETATTAAPTTAAPTAALAKGSITVSFQMDEYPEEVSWILDEKGQEEPLFFHDNDPDMAAAATTTETFDNLVQGQTYYFRVSDSEGDGICCLFGPGQVTIHDENKGVDIFTASNYGTYYEVDFTIDDQGYAVITSQSANYKPSTWEELEASFMPNANFDAASDWPGAMPSAPANSIVVNVHTDDYPEETEWQLFRQPDASSSTTATSRSDAGELIQSWKGETTMTRQLVSTEINALTAGWYRFVVSDAEGDGNCCSYGSGFVTLTGPLAAANGEFGLIWGNDGEFWALDEIFFLMDDSGYISYINFAGVP